MEKSIQDRKRHAEEDLLSLKVTSKQSVQRDRVFPILDSLKSETTKIHFPNILGIN